MEGKNKQNQRATGTESGGPGMVNTERCDAPLSARRAFVVQFRKTAAEELAGRVEHIASAEASLFSCERDLFDFFRRILTTVAEEEGGRSK